jgi:chemotaxis protein MotB
VVKPGSQPLLHEVARLIVHTGITNPLRVEGHTDNVPISGGPFANNWELSAARATAVLEQFLADGIPPRQLSMAGYADQQPIAPNTTDDGRALNRRVEVVVTRKFPVPAGATPS